MTSTAFKRQRLHRAGLHNVGWNYTPFHEHILCPKCERHSANELTAVFNVQTVYVGWLHLQETLAEHVVADTEATNDGRVV